MQKFLRQNTNDQIDEPNKQKDAEEKLRLGSNDILALMVGNKKRRFCRISIFLLLHKIESIRKLENLP